MPEVFSISGFGQPEGWVVTPRGNYGAPRAGCPKNRQVGAQGCRHPAALKLQRALKQAGVPIKVDGFIGPKTAMVVNNFLGMNLAPEEVAGRATALAVRVQEKILAEGPKPAPTPAPQPPPAPAAEDVPAETAPVEPPPAPVRRRPSRAAWAVVGLGGIAAITGAWFAYSR